MASESANTVALKQFPTLCHLGVVGNLSDGQLLELFLAGTKETAETSFAALVDRHGPMVLRACRQILGNPDDAQDAFQATFLVLVRQARSVRKRDSLACWLYGVAQRVARRARVDAARRQAHERRCAATAREQDMAPEDDPECCWTELHDELSRLPERYRESVVLCYLQGLSTQAAAQRLGCPQGTVLSRLSRARDQLRKRLTRRGVAVPAGLLTAGLATEVARARRASHPRTCCHPGCRRFHPAPGRGLGSDLGHCRPAHARSSQNHVLHEIEDGRSDFRHGRRPGDRGRGTARQDTGARAASDSSCDRTDAHGSTSDRIEQVPRPPRQHRRTQESRLEPGTGRGTGSGLGDARCKIQGEF